MKHDRQKVHASFEEERGYYESDGWTLRHRNKEFVATKDKQQQTLSSMLEVVQFRCSGYPSSF